MSVKTSQAKNFDASKKISQRLGTVIRELKMDMAEFSVRIGKNRSWAFNILKRETGAVKANELVLMNEIFSINPNYILFEQEPMFLECKKT